ncbi:MAG: hypothetical protein JOZ70_07840 [Pseudolabrys sp.]|nr:hypothetical protein [Pseudolabrys sp.]
MVRLSPTRKLDVMRPVLKCEDCGDVLYNPEWSEFLGEGQVRHAWRCEACGCRFETTFRLEAA